MQSIVRIELNETRLRDWVSEARPMLKKSGQSLRTFRRVVRAGGASTVVFVAVLDHGGDR